MVFTKCLKKKVCRLLNWQKQYKMSNSVIIELTDESCYSYSAIIN